MPNNNYNDHMIIKRHLYTPNYWIDIKVSIMVQVCLICRMQVSQLKKNVKYQSQPTCRPFKLHVKQIPWASLVVGLFFAYCNSNTSFIKSECRNVSLSLIAHFWCVKSFQFDCQLSLTHYRDWVLLKLDWFKLKLS